MPPRRRHEGATEPRDMGIASTSSHSCAAVASATSRVSHHTLLRHGDPSSSARNVVGTLLLCSLVALPAASAQSIFFTAPAAPDWSSLHALLSIAFFVVAWPAFAISMLLLWRARGRYPIAGRGAPFLLATNAVLLVAAPLLTIVSLWYATGVPCGLVFLAAAGCVLPLSLAYMLRGWLLVFKLENISFIAELKFREADLVRRKEEAAKAGWHASGKEQGTLFLPRDGGEAGDLRRSGSDDTPGPNSVETISLPAIDLPSTTVGLSRSSAAVHPVHARVAAIGPIVEEASGASTPHSTGKDKARTSHSKLLVAPATPSLPECVEMSSIPGYWFIQHRYLIQPRWLLGFVGGLITFIFSLALLIFLILDDPDVAATNKAMVRDGVYPADAPPYYTRSQLHPSELLYAAPCQLSSAKLLFIQAFIVGLLAPLVLWIVWRVRSNAKRTAQREAEVRTRKLAESGDLARDRTHAHSHAQQAATLAHIRARHSNDTDAVKTELAAVGVVALYVVGAYPLFSYFAKPYILFDVLLPLAAIELISIAHPLWVAYRLARSNRRFLLAERQRTLASPGSSEDHLRLAHHRPFYRLRFIMRSEHTYPVFLKFLEKEHSSENALFIKAVRGFEVMCHDLEARVATWPKTPEDEDFRPQVIVRHPHSHVGGHHNPTSTVGSRQTQAHRPASRTRVVTNNGNGSNGSIVRLGPYDPSSEDGGVEALTLGTRISGGDRSNASSPVPQARGLKGARPLAVTTSTGNSPVLRPMIIVTPAVQQPFSPPESTLATSRVPPSLSLHHETELTTTMSVQVHSPSHGALSPPARAHPSPFTSPSPSHASQQTPHQTPIQSHATLTNLASSKMSRRLYSFEEMQSLHTAAREVRTSCLQIYSRFLAPGCISEVNVSDDLHSLIHSQMRLVRMWSPSPLTSTGAFAPLTKDSLLPAAPPLALSTLYRQTALTVFEMVQADSFRRFILTDEFLDLLLRADEAELVRQQSQESLEEQTRSAVAEAVLTLRVREEDRQGFDTGDRPKADALDEDHESEHDFTGMDSPRPGERRKKASKRAAGYRSLVDPAHSRSGGGGAVHLHTGPGAGYATHLDAPQSDLHRITSNDASRLRPSTTWSAPGSLAGSKRGSLDRGEVINIARGTTAAATEQALEWPPVAAAAAASSSSSSALPPKRPANGTAKVHFGRTRNPSPSPDLLTPGQTMDLQDL